MSNGRLTYASYRRGQARPAKGIRTQLLGRLHGLKVWTVNGTRIRDSLDIDFTSGGTSARYNYVPKLEVWIDECLNKFDRCATIIHEIVERERMLKDKLSYNKAHDKANEVETVYRSSDGDGNIKKLNQLLKKYRKEGLW